MSDEDADRLDLAAALRDLNHAFVGHDVDPELLRSTTELAVDLAARFRAGARRDRLALMQASRREAEAEAAAAGASGGFPMNRPRSGFEDRAVAGRANPTSIDFDVRFDDEDDVVAEFVLRRAFEGAPGRAHGGIVAAAFDDITGWVIGRLGEPAFTGELTVRFVAPVPVDERLTVRTRLAERDRRKLFITAELTAADQLIATCRATYITVDPSVFAGMPDPR